MGGAHPGLRRGMGGTMNWLKRLLGQRTAPVNAEPSQRPLPRSSATPGTAGLSSLQVGDLIADTYEVLRVLPGGMGIVYIARHREWRTTVAVKVPSPELVRAAEGRRRFELEAEAWTDLGLHPNIAYCYYVQPIDDVPMLVVEYVDGGNLRDLIAEGTHLRLSLDFAIQACHGLEHAHSQGKVHRDIKPENILLSGVQLKLTDFGLVRMGDHGTFDSAADVETASANPLMTSLTKAGGMGTPAYMPPEQWIDAHAVDARGDIFALGVCLYELLCGKRPYDVAVGPRQDAPDPSNLREDDELPPSLCSLLKMCVDWDPKNRPDTARTLLTSLSSVYAEIFEEESLYARLPPTPLPADGWNNRGVSYHHLGKQDAAEDAWTKAVESDPAHPEAIYNLGLVRWRSGRASDIEVVTKLQAVESLAPNDPRTRYCLGLVHMERGAFALATETLEEASRLASDEQEQITQALTAAGSQRDPLRQTSVLQGHTGWITCVEMTPDGGFAISGSEDTTLRLWNLKRGKCVRSLEGHAGSVKAVALTDDGRLAISAADKDLDPTLWDLSNGQCIRTLRTLGARECPTTVDITPDGRLAVSAGYDALRVWDVMGDCCLHTFRDGSGPAAITRDGRFVVSGGVGRAIYVWELSSGHCAHKMTGHDAYLTSLAVSDGGRIAVSGGADCTLRVWDLADGRCLRVLEGDRVAIDSLAITTDGRFAICADTTAIRLWDLTSGRCLRTFGDGRVETVAIASDGRHAVSAGWDHTVSMWTLPDGIPALAPLAVSRSRAASAMIDDSVAVKTLLDSARASLEAGDAAGAFDHTVKAMSVPGHERSADLLEVRYRSGTTGRRTSLADSWELRRLDGHRGPVTSLAVGGDGRLAVSGSGDFTVRVWNLASGSCLNSLEGHGGAVAALAVTANGQFALSGSYDGTLRYWDLQRGHCAQVLKGHNSRVLDVGMSADGRLAVSGSGDETVRLWDLVTGHCIRTVECHGGDVDAIAITADGRLVVSGGEARVLRLWDSMTGQCLGTLEGHADDVLCLAVTEDGRLAVSGSLDDTLRVWDLSNQRCLRALEGHSEAVTSVSLLRDGRFALSGSFDGTLRLWDLTSGSCLSTLKGHTAAVNDTALTPNARLAVSAGADNVLRVWEMTWNYEFPSTEDWHDDARPFLEVFLALHRPVADDGLSRIGSPQWTPEDFERLIVQLRDVGLGWLRVDGVRQKLEQLSAHWDT